MRQYHLSVAFDGRFLFATKPTEQVSELVQTYSLIRTGIMFPEPCPRYTVELIQVSTTNTASDCANCTPATLTEYLSEYLTKQDASEWIQRLKSQL